MEETYRLEDLPTLVEKIWKTYRNYKIWTFFGEMGSGKTTFIKTLGKMLNIAQNIQSPTFALIHEYQNSDSLFYHYDLYRLKNITEILDLGVEEQWYSGAFCWIEWAEKAQHILPVPRLELHFSTLNETERKINILTKN